MWKLSTETTRDATHSMPKCILKADHLLIHTTIIVYMLKCMFGFEYPPHIQPP